MTEAILAEAAVPIGEASAEEPEKESRLIKQLKEWRDRKHRAALANLRRGLGKAPGSAMEMYPYLGQFLSDPPKPRYEKAVFIVSSLFAYYPEASGNVGNLGESMRRLSEKTKSDSIEKRFVALLNADDEDLPNYLRQAIGLLKSNEIAVNWERLFKDVWNWNEDERRVQKEWARRFWGDTANKKDQTSKPIGGKSE